MDRDNEKAVWYALQTRYSKELVLKEYFVSQNLECFIPLRYVETYKDGVKEKHYEPAIHNLLFIQKADDAFDELINNSPVPFWVLRHEDNHKPYEIPEHEMLEMRAVCDPDYTGTVYTDVETAEARPGTRVRVIRGPFKGLEGKLTQYQRRYYVVITTATMGVMLHIPKWYCEKI